MRWVFKSIVPIGEAAMEFKAHVEADSVITIWLKDGICFWSSKKSKLSGSILHSWEEYRSSPMKKALITASLKMGS